MISPINFNIGRPVLEAGKNNFDRRLSFGSTSFKPEDFEKFLQSKTYDFICPDSGKLYCASEWVMSDGDILELAKKGVVVVDFDYSRSLGAKKFARKQGLAYFGIDEISQSKDIKSCYQDLVNFTQKIKKPVLLYSMRTKDEPLYLCALYLIKEKGLPLPDVADMIRRNLVIQPWQDVAENLQNMLKKLDE